MKRFFSQIRKVQYIQGESKLVQNNEVNLRGLYMKGDFEDLPNLIFFPQNFDQAENWINFFSHKKIIKARNIYLLYPRNFGNSDYSNSFYVEDMVKDVERFMNTHKITTATLGGHGLGAMLALAFGCFNSYRTTGVFCLDYSPLDYRNFKCYEELANYIVNLYKINLKSNNRKEIIRKIDEIVLNKHWNKIFKENLKVKNKEYYWDFNMNFIKKSIFSLNNFTSFESNIGLFGGRALFMFPEYSDWVFLGTNTIPMYNKCVHLEGYGKDILNIPSNDTPSDNHFIYKMEKESLFLYQNRLANFLNLKDGVHVLLKDRNDIGKEFIPELTNSKKNREYYSNHSPAHHHHNWGFNN